MNQDREREVSQAFVTLASHLALGYDVVDLLTTLTTNCARLLDVDSAGLLLANNRGVLHVLAASSDASHDLELLQLQSEEGPCLDCYHGGVPVSIADLTKETERWPRFAPAAVEAGFRSVHAVPLRLRDQFLGAVNLFGTHAGALNEDDLNLGQALADVASVSLVQDKLATDSRVLAAQLQNALNSRVLIEQAKGILAQFGNLEMGPAFNVLQRYARDHNERLTDVAFALVSRELPAEQVLAHAVRKGAVGRR
ncbi:MAG TPA: GAF and ANTAR domain-containing protein [Frankiaceae bacterium]|nr:GAF and ANTAR domain-containing protein [Frankiaceae bacterium]